MGSLIGHVYPACFLLLFALYFLAACVHADTARSKVIVGTYLMSLTVVAIIIEGIGGVKTYNNFFFQYAHQVTYFGYHVAGVVSIAEAFTHVPDQSWRLTLAFAFCNEAVIMYGHAAMQHGTEAAMHVVSVYTAFIVAFFLIFGALMSDSKHAPTFHALMVGGVMFKGLWLLCIGYVVFSGAFGVNGEHMTMEHLFTYVGVLAVLCELVTLGCLCGTRPKQEYLPVVEEGEKCGV